MPRVSIRNIIEEVVIEQKMSIVTVTYNSKSSLEETILSVINQTYKNIEYIIIDGGSTDGTVDIIKKYSNEITAWLSEPDKGIYDAMNKGILIASGDWINFMNSGDKFVANDILAFVNEVTSSDQNTDILYGGATITYPTFTTPFKNHPVNTLWKNSPFCHQASFIRTSLMKDYKYDVSYKIGADQDFFFRAYVGNKTFTKVNRLICYFNGEDGATKRNIKMAIIDKMNIALKYEFSIAKWIYYRCFIIYIIINNSIKKMIGPQISLWLSKKIKG